MSGKASVPRILDNRFVEWDCFPVVDAAEFGPRPEKELHGGPRVWSFRLHPSFRVVFAFPQRVAYI